MSFAAVRYAKVDERKAVYVTFIPTIGGWHMKRLLMLSALLSVVMAGTVFAQDARNVVINRVRVSDQAVQALEAYYRTIIPDGSYWYDPVSGLWGVEGGPAAGKMLPYLELGGPLRADASGGGTGVFINGRELHPLEVYYLWQLFGVVLPGPYWLDADGVGGYEGGPPLFDLAASAAHAGGYNYVGPGGTMGSDGNCFYYNDPETGSSYLPPGC